MLVFDNMCVDLNYKTLEVAKEMPVPIIIQDRDNVDEGTIELSLDQAR